MPSPSASFSSVAVPGTLWPFFALRIVLMLTPVVRASSRTAMSFSSMRAVSRAAMSTACTVTYGRVDDKSATVVLGRT